MLDLIFMLILFFIPFGLICALIISIIRYFNAKRRALEKQEED